VQHAGGLSTQALLSPASTGIALKATKNAIICPVLHAGSKLKGAATFHFATGKSAIYDADSHDSIAWLVAPEPGTSENAARTILRAPRALK
jgi:hypothetical protein